MCEKAKQDNVTKVVIAHPRILGDNYGEVIESLARIAEAKLLLQITSQ